MAALALAVTLLAACGKAEAQSVTISQLAADPERYNGELVRTEGIYVQGFETSALAESTRREGDAFYLNEPIIFLDSAAIVSRGECFTTELVPPAEFCEVVVEGRFEYGGRYAHLGAYRYRTVAVH